MNGHDPLEPDVPDDVTDDGFDDDLGDELGDRLRMLLGPSDGLDRRTTRDVDSALRARSPLAAAVELFGVGWWTIETLFTDRTPGGDGDGDGQTLTGDTRGADRDVEGP